MQLSKKLLRPDETKHRTSRTTESRLLEHEYDTHYKNMSFAGYGDMARMDMTYEILDRTIESLDPILVGQLLGGDEDELDDVFDDIIKETNRILFGNNKEKKIPPTLRYLSELDSVLREELRRSDLTYFNSDVLNMEINWHHIEWGWLVKNFPLIAILAARDHGKSYYFSNGYPIWQAYRYDPMSVTNEYQLGKLGYLFSNTMPQIVELMEILQDTVETNDIVREKLYHPSKIEWSKTRIRFKNGARVRARSFGSSVRGAHPRYIVVDDPLKDNVLYSPLQRERGKVYFNSVIMNMLIPNGQMIVVGTPFHKEDLYSLFRKSADFAMREYPAEDSKGRVLWPARYDRARLDAKKRQQGPIVYARELLVKPISDESSMFPERILQSSLLGMNGISYVRNVEESKIKFSRIVTGCDFALSSEVGADWTSFVTFGIDERENMWLLNLYHEQGVGLTEQKRALRRIWRNFRPNLMYLEANQFQKLYTEILKDETNMPVKAFTTGRNKHHLEHGVPGLVIVFENGKFRFPYSKDSRELTDTVLEEFRSIGWTEKGIQGVGAHDDIVMSIWLARCAALEVESDFVVDFA